MSDWKQRLFRELENLRAGPVDQLGQNIMVFGTADAGIVNNLFRMNRLVETNTLSAIVLDRVMGVTKFSPIIIKEAYSAVAPGGVLVVKERRKNSIDEWKIRQQIFNLLGAETVYHSIADFGGDDYHVVFKPAIGADPACSLREWSFGIVTNGTRDKYVREFVLSVLRQDIPEFEILICGSCNRDFILSGLNSRDSELIKFIPFDEDCTKGWITRKKNLIGHAARYENLAIFHDRFVLDDAWYKGMKEYGADFEVISCINQMPDGRRSEDWAATVRNLPARVFSDPEFDPSGVIARDFPVMLFYEDWDPNAYIPGGMIILKKRIWKLCPWDERFFWGEREDVWLSHLMTSQGAIPRFNPHSKVITFSGRGNTSYMPRMNSKRRGVITPSIRYMAACLRYKIKGYIKCS